TEYSRLPFGGNPTHVTEIVQPNQGGYRAFRDAQTPGRAWLTRWSSVGAVKEVAVAGEVTPALNPYVAAFVAERCSIRTEFISGYGHETRRTLFGLDPFPALADKRVRLAPDPNLMRRAHLLLIGS